VTPADHLRGVLDADLAVGPPVTGEEEADDTAAIGDALAEPFAALAATWREEEGTP
jgi:hypothetical protein